MKRCFKIVLVLALVLVYSVGFALSSTQLAKYAVGSGKNSGGGARDAEEFVLKQNTLYLFRITEGNVAATNINWELDWYEHTNKN